MAPTNVKELIVYLTDHRRVRMDFPGKPPEKLAFSSQADGGLWFTREADGFDVYIPIECGMTDRETGLAFDGAAFTVTKFGLVTVFDYLPDEAP